MTNSPYFRAFAVLLFITPFVVLAQSGLFHDSLELRRAVRTTDGGYCIRSGDWMSSNISRYAADWTPMWANEYRLFSGGNFIRPDAIEEGVDGKVVLVGVGSSQTTGDFPNYVARHYITTAQIGTDGSVLAAKEHVLITEPEFQPEHMSSYSYINEPVTTSATGDLFLTLSLFDLSLGEAAIMKVNADGSFAWCMRSPNDLYIMSRVLPDGSGGCYVVLYDGSVSDEINVVHLGSDGNTLWSRVITRESYSFFYPFHLNLTTDDRLLVVGMSDNNLARLRMTLDGELEEFRLISTLPVPGLGVAVSAFGSVLGADGSMTMITGGISPHPYRAVRSDASGVVTGAWTTPLEVEGTWTTGTYIHSVRGGDSVLTAVGSLSQTESIFGFSISRPMVISSPLDLSGLCNLAPVQYAQITLPLSQIEVTDAAPFTPLAHEVTTDVEVTVTVIPQDQPQDLCAFIAVPVADLSDAPNQLNVYPVPVASGAVVNIGTQPGDEVRIVDAAGQLVKRTLAQSTRLEINADVAPGVYVVILQGSKGERRAARLVVQ